MAKAFVEIVGDAERFVLSLKQSQAAVSTFRRDLGELNLSVTKSAETQVKASALRMSRIREEISAVQRLASTYVRGSDEQIAAMNLVARKQSELARMQGAAATRYGVAGGRGSNLRRDERAASGLARGGLRGAGVGGFGLAALAGGAFFSSYLGTSAVRTTIDAATNAAAIEKQLAAQYRASGESLAAYRKQIDETLNRESALAGFNKDELTQSYISIFRAAGNTSGALKDEAIAVDLARGRHMDLQAAALLVAKVINGNVGILKRYGIETWKGETATQALAAIQAKYAGQAKAGTTAQERFSAELHNSEVIIGTALLPTVTHLLSEGAKWLDQMNRSGRLQRDVNTAIHDGAIVVGIFKTGINLLTGAIRTVDRITGGFKHTLEILLAMKVASMVGNWTGVFGGLSANVGKAETKAVRLRGTLGNLAKIGAFSIGITLLVNAKGNGVGLLERMAGGALIGGSVAGLPGAVAGAVAVPLAQGSYAAGHSLRGPLGLGGGGSPAQPSVVPKQYSYDTDAREAYLAGLQGNGYPFKLGDPTHLQYLAVYEAGRKARSRAQGGGRTGRGTPAGRTPIHEFALPTRLQNQLAAATTPAEDRKAAQAALNYTQRLIDSGRLVGQAYTDALKERKKLYAEIARDAKKLAGRGAGAGGSLLPASAQVAIAKAQGDAASKSLPALQRLLHAEQDALATLRAQHQVGAARVKQVKEEAQLQQKIAATQKAIATAETQQQKAAQARKAEQILGIGGGKQMPVADRLRLQERQILNTSLAHAVFGSKATQAQIAYITKKTANLNLSQLVELVHRDLGDKVSAATVASLEKINKAFALKFLPPDAIANIRSRLAQIKQTLEAGLNDIGQGYQAFHGVSSAQFVADIPGLTRAQKIALEERYAQVQAHGGMASGTAAAGIVIPAAKPGGNTIHIGQITVHGVQNLDQLIKEIEKRSRSKNQRRGNRR